MNKAYLLIGGNLGDRKKYLEEAVKLIEQNCGSVTKLSSVYETEAWGFTDQPSFYNQAVELQTSFSAKVLMLTLLKIEEQMGRKRTQKMGPRVIDIDILLFNDEIITNNIVTIPHPHLTERRFALIPLAEIAGDVIHPTTNKSITQLLEDCTDTLDVHKISLNN